MHAVVEESDYRLRGGVIPLFQFLHRHRVPVLLLSCGLADFSRDRLVTAAIMTENIHFASNFLTFTPDGFANGTAYPVVHPFNKREDKLATPVWINAAGGRQNVVVVGDHKWDSTVVPDEGNVILRIGIVSSPDSALRHDRTVEMLEHYDVVLQGEDCLIDLLCLWRLILGVPAALST
jgi:hypothetical protein